MTLDARSGAIRQIEDRSSQGAVLRGGANLWVIERRDEPEVDSSAGNLAYRWNAEDRKLTLVFDSPDATVTIICIADESGPAWQASVRMKQGTMIGWRFPDSWPHQVEQPLFPGVAALPEHSANGM